MATNFNTVVTSSASNAQITSAGDDALITKDYADTFYSGGGGGGGGTPVSAYFLQLTGANGSTHTITQSATTLPLDTSREISDSSHFTISSGEVTVVNAGDYFIDYSIDSDQSGGNRVIVTGFIEVSTNGGTTFSEVRGTRGHDYSRNNTQEESTTQGSSIIVLGAGDILRVRVQRDSTVATSANTELSHFAIFSINKTILEPAGTDSTDNPTALDLSNVAGTYYTDTTSTTATYTIASGAVAGGFAYVNVTRTQEPDVTGATKLTSPTYSQPMKMIVYNDGNSSYYYFLEE
jgi:hypothetical protein